MWATDGVEPDRVILLEVSASVSAARQAARGHADRMEREGADFFARVQAGYAAQAAADPARWRIVDGSGTDRRSSRTGAGRRHGLRGKSSRLS